jgi:hypothetical protein
MTDARIVEWNAVLDGFDMIRPTDPETDVDYYLRKRRTRDDRPVRRGSR